VENKQSEQQPRQKSKFKKYFVGLHNSTHVPTWVGADIAASAFDHCAHNFDFFRDFAIYNFANKFHVPERDGRLLSAGNLPDRIQSAIDQIRRSLGHPSAKDLRDRLNIPRTSRSENSPLEFKWLFDYYKKHQTLQYDGHTVVDVKELLTPLNTSDANSFSRYF
jgi:hypothetical protein